MVFVPEMLTAGTAGKERRGVVLLVVMALLALFAAVGLSFVFYADSEAAASMTFREAADIGVDHYNVEALANFFLAQFLYDGDDTNGVYSAMRGHSLARNMYGYQAGAINCAAFSGLGRAHFNQTAAAINGQDNFNLLNYTYYPSDNFIRDPERMGHRADNKAAQTNPFVASNVSYTYPDHNNVYLGAVNASWEVLLQSYRRPWLGAGKYNMLQPDPTWNPVLYASLPDADGGGHVKNLENSPGTVYYDGMGNKKYYKNDSYWMDLGFPTLVANGVKYRPLFAPLIIDLDGKLNLNAHGNIRAAGNNHASSHGIGPWEVNLARAMTNQPDLAKLFLGTTIAMKTYKGRYGPNGKPASGGTFSFPAAPYYSRLDLNGVDSSAAPSAKFLLPGEGGNPNPGYYPWPYYDANAYGDPQDLTDHPGLFNALTAVADDRIFDWTDQEALLRYGLKGSIGSKSELFQLYPNFGTIPRVRGLVGSKSFDVGRPGATGWLIPTDAAHVPYDWKSGDPYPMAAASPFPSASFPATPTAEFGAGWSGANIGLGKLDLNRVLSGYPGVDGTTGQITDLPGFNAAQSERQQFARDIYNRLRLVTTGKSPTVFPTKGTDEWNALRWLAQLAVNMVDFRDSDDYITPFNWDTTDNSDAERWVYGTELPKLVINESYVEVITDTADPLDGAMKATMPYRVNIWVELLNPKKDDGAGTNTARLQIPAVGASPMVPSYKLTIAAPPGSGSPFIDLNTGKPDPSNTKLEVADFSPEGAPTPQPLAGVDVHLVLPANTNYSGTNGKNEGFYLLGPKDDFPSTAGATPTPPLATLRVKEQTLSGVKSAMTYTIPNSTLPANFPSHNLFLRRLACPYLPEQSDPKAANYNPYITVDYVTSVPARDGVKNDTVIGPRTPTAIYARRAVGRMQPYAAHSSQQVNQDPSTANTNQPQHTFFRHNGREASAPTNSATLTQPFNWLVQMDRFLTSPVEIMQVAAFQPYQLTQQFITGNAANQKYTHRAPWFDPATRLYRFFEFAEVRSLGIGVSTGGRIPGKINVNTIYGPEKGADTGDIEIFRALADAQGISSFTAADVDTIFSRMLAARNGGGGTPGIPGSNGLNERPFKSLATGNIASGDPQFPLGSGIDDTLLRVDPVDNTKRLFEFNPAAGSNPHLKLELLNKIFNNVTTRSNVFAVWLTVGFFEVVDDTVKPARLGAEIGRASNKHIRHRIFAMVDRTQLKLFPKMGAVLTGKVSGTTPGTQTITCQTKSIDGVNSTRWDIQPGMLLEIDSGSGNTETVVVLPGVTLGSPGSFSAIFTRNVGATVNITCRGNPGPVSSSNPAVPPGTNPTYDFRQDPAVVTYFGVID
ncbi:MAG: hypothetical protein FJ271_07960 [Planctomycetes bacterium]|nr:hypothetical protein [Planctomycetota bacterium]